MIYLDTSVLLAQLLSEDRRPRAALWRETLVSSRLLEYEVWTRIHARGLADSHGELVREAIGRVALVEMISDVLSRALEVWPIPVRTLDALHLATLLFLRDQGQELVLASYDERMRAAARAVKVPLFRL